MERTAKKGLLGFQVLKEWLALQEPKGTPAPKVFLAYLDSRGKREMKVR